VVGVDTARGGIWRYWRLFDPTVPPEAQVSLGEGDTPAVELPGLAGAIGLDRLVLKREDLNPTGSHKDRGVAYQVSALRRLRPDLTWLVVSSSGNAAIAAAAYARATGLHLAAFIARDTDPSKRAALVALDACVFATDRAITLAQALADARGWPNLRPSVDPLAVEGFQTIAWELAERVAPVEALFTFAASGASLVGIGRAFERAAAVTAHPWRASLHVVQGTGAHPIVGDLDRRDVPDARGRVGAMGARKTRRLGEARRLIAASRGSGWVVTDDEADAAARLLADHGIDTSLEGAASLSAAARAARAGAVRSAVVVLTGRARRARAVAGSGADAGWHEVTDLAGVLDVLDAFDEAGRSAASDTAIATRSS
jgi:threonine synthase